VNGTERSVHASLLKGHPAGTSDETAAKVRLSELANPTQERTVEASTSPITHVAPATSGPSPRQLPSRPRRWDLRGCRWLLCAANIGEAIGYYMAFVFFISCGLQLARRRNSARRRS
jgi:hypothetical protein